MEIETTLRIPTQKTAYRKKIHIRLDDDLHKRLRMYVAEHATTIQKFITDLLDKNLP